MDLKFNFINHLKKKKQTPVLIFLHLCASILEQCHWAGTVVRMLCTPPWYNFLTSLFTPEQWGQKTSVEVLQILLPCLLEPFELPWFSVPQGRVLLCHLIEQK